MIRNPYPRHLDDRAERRGTDRDQQPDQRRGGHLLGAATTGLTTGSARAVIDWLLEHFLGT